MFLKKGVAISKKMYEHSLLSIYYCRILGFFPVTVEKVGTRLFLKWSPYYALYGAALASLWIVSAVWELKTVHLDNPAWSITDKVTQIIANGGWVTINFLGVFVTGNSFSTFSSYIKHINEVDSIIKTDYKKSEKYLGIFLMIFFPTFAVLQAVNTCIVYIKRGRSIEDYLIERQGFYTLIAFSTTVFYTIRQMVNGLEKRLGKLNELLKMKNQNLHNLKEEVSGVTHGYRSASEIAGNIQSDRRIPELRRAFTIEESLSKVQINDFDTALLARLYLKLCDAAQLLNDLFSTVLLVGIVTAFVQVVQPTYFFIERVKTNSPEATSLLRTALITLSRNFCCVLMVIESTYGCDLQVHAMEKFVCRLFCWKNNSQARLQVRRFAICLGLRRLEFSAGGILTVNRFLFTEMISSAITFLMLLLQLQDGS